MENKDIESSKSEKLRAETFIRDMKLHINNIDNEIMQLKHHREGLVFALDTFETVQASIK